MNVDDRSALLLTAEEEIGTSAADIRRLSSSKHSQPLQPQRSIELTAVPVDADEARDRLDGGHGGPAAVEQMDDKGIRNDVRLLCSPTRRSFLRLRVSLRSLMTRYALDERSKRWAPESCLPLLCCMGDTLGFPAATPAVHQGVKAPSWSPRSCCLVFAMWLAIAAWAMVVLVARFGVHEVKRVYREHAGHELPIRVVQLHYPSVFAAATLVLAGVVLLLFVFDYISHRRVAHSFIEGICDKVRETSGTGSGSVLVEGDDRGEGGDVYRYRSLHGGEMSDAGGSFAPTMTSTVLSGPTSSLSAGHPLTSHPHYGRGMVGKLLAEVDALELRIRNCFTLPTPRMVGPTFDRIKDNCIYAMEEDLHTYLSIALHRDAAKASRPFRTKQGMLLWAAPALAVLAVNLLLVGLCWLLRNKKRGDRLEGDVGEIVCGLVLNGAAAVYVGAINAVPCVVARLRSISHRLVEVTNELVNAQMMLVWDENVLLTLQPILGECKVPMPATPHSNRSSHAHGHTPQGGRRIRTDDTHTHTNTTASRGPTYQTLLRSTRDGEGNLLEYRLFQHKNKTYEARWVRVPLQEQDDIDAI
ncbi:unnamed protein product [Vitrella brassicaformis CCMP3155]|uniref:Uncharacterized protein n=3 Tax=Vitrella brassicaformis TaxID=1169539 RepID=A0A0G4H2F3_VITBC|nr:unnamed protein product [Vitrella brassicaformis CCMP3155]|eukprot:CEM37774.1 unnamed protein product [Vitrella brassicaformis CCMP3155]